MKKKSMNDFERASASQENSGFFSEFWGFLKYNKKWWLAPIIICLLLLGLLVLMSSSGVAPFIYTLF